MNPARLPAMAGAGAGAGVRAGGRGFSMSSSLCLAGLIGRLRTPPSELNSGTWDTPVRPNDDIAIDHCQNYEHNKSSVFRFIHVSAVCHGIISQVATMLDTELLLLLTHAATGLVGMTK